MRCLIQFIDEWADFRYAELRALCKLYSISYSVLDGSTWLPGAKEGSSVADGKMESTETGGAKRSREDDTRFDEVDKSSLFLHVEMDADEATIRQAFARSVLIRNVYELWAHSSCYTDLVKRLQHVYDGGSPLIHDYLSADLSWSIEIETIGKRITFNLQSLYREKLKFIAFKGKVRINNPDIPIHVVLDFSKYTNSYREMLSEERNSTVFLGGKELAQDVSGDSDMKPIDINNIPVYAGRLIARGDMREVLKKFDLKTRPYLGPTTLDETLTFLLANLAGVKKGDYVMDPFVGTASILMALAYYGAFCVGTDIDIRVIKGNMYAGHGRHNVTETENKRRDIQSTFKTYGLQQPELLRLDLHCLEKHFKNDVVEGVFDSIVTDPPYGIRAGGRKSGRAKALDYKIDEERRDSHIPATQQYPVEEVMLDLLHSSAQLLRVGGSLCYLIPTPYDFEPSDLPEHPCFEMEELCLQMLSTRHGRHAVLLRKTQEYTPERQAEFAAYKEKVLSEESTAFGELAKKLAAAVAAGARNDEKVVKHISANAQRRRNQRQKKIELREQRLKDQQQEAEGTNLDNDNAKEVK